jgi:hypothetical protein
MESTMNARTTKRGRGDVPGQNRRGESFATAEQVLLFCFGSGRDASTTHSGKELREALTAAGFHPAAARHLVRDSALLLATPERDYVLRPFDGAPAGH